MPKYQIVSDLDGNDTFEVEGADENCAAHNALRDLGWWVAAGPEDDEAKEQT